MTVEPKGFEPACLVAFDDLRVALIELYASVGADPQSPQDAARRFRVNKTLTWNVSRVMSSTDPLATLPSVPGTSALKGLLQAMRREGASAAAVERVRRAVEALERTVSFHVGDRATLELVVDGLRRPGADRLDLSRKLAFRGNSGLWGVQARVRLMTVFMAPNASAPDRIDMAIVRGYIGFRRLRDDVSWPIFQLRGWGEEDGAMVRRWEALEAGHGNGLPILKQFSTVSSDDLREVRTPRGADYLLQPGPIGNAGAIDCFVGDFERAAASKYRTEVDTTGEFGATISVPTKLLVFDLLAHEGLDFASRPEVRAYGGLFMERSEDPALESTRLPIPVERSVAPLPGKPPAVASPNVPRYPEIVAFVNERMGWDAGEFTGCRLQLSHPPLGSTILLRFKLPSP